MNGSNIYILERSNTLRLFLSFALIFFILSMHNEVFATATASTDVIGGKLCAVVKILTGATAKAVATVAIFFLGIGLFMGKVNWGVGAVTIIGIVVIFSANTFIDVIGGSGASAVTCA